MLRSCKEFRCNWRSNESHGAGEAGAWGDVIYFFGQRERLVVKWGAGGEQEGLGASYCSVPDDGERERSKADRFKVHFR